MKKDQRGFTVTLGILIFAILIGGGALIYFNKGGENNSPEALVADLKNKIADAQERLESETSKLNYLSGVFRDFNPVFSLVQDHYDMINDAVKRTDPLFREPDSTRPQLKIKAKDELKKDLEARRSEINERLSRWRQMATLATAGDPGSVPLSTLQSDATEIQSYINEVAEFVATLTPANSGLTQTEINTYVDAMTTASQNVASVVASLTQAIASTPTTPPPTQSPAQNQTVTATTVAQQQAVVDALAAQVAALQQQLNQITGQTPTTTPPTTAPQVNIQSTGVIHSYKYYLPGPVIDTSQFPDRSTTPDPTDLIEGSNGF